jgi:outer membrane lipoprotein carrier protein
MKKVVFVILYFFTTTLLAQSATMQLSNLLKNTHTLKANFIQIVLDEHKHAMSKSSGNFVLQQPNKFYWHVKQPMQHVIINNGKKVWDYQPDLQQVVVKPISQAIATTPLAILSGSTSALTKNFIISRESNSTFKLTNKHSNSFKTVWLYFNNGKIAGMQLQDILGQTTRLQFTHVEINPSVSTQQFIFKRAKGVDLINSMS